MHGVKEGGRIFSAAIGASEVMFERCGTAIIGKLTDENQEAIDRDMSRRIAEAYQLIVEQVNEISCWQRCDDESPPRSDGANHFNPCLP